MPTKHHSRSRQWMLFEGMPLALIQIEGPCACPEKAPLHKMLWAAQLYDPEGASNQRSVLCSRKLMQSSLITERPLFRQPRARHPTWRRTNAQLPLPRCGSPRHCRPHRRQCNARFVIVILGFWGFHDFPMHGLALGSVLVEKVKSIMRSRFLSGALGFGFST